MVGGLVLAPACGKAPAAVPTPADGAVAELGREVAEGGVPSLETGGPAAPADGGIEAPPPDHQAWDALPGGEPLDATVDSVAALQPIRVIRGDPNQATWFDLTLVASGLGEYEGAVVTARIGSPDRPPERLGSGQVRIARGAFEMVFPDVLEPRLYKFKRFFIDLDGDGGCDPGEPVYSDARFATTDLTLTIAPGSSLLARDGNRCANFAAPWPER